MPKMPVDGLPATQEVIHYCADANVRPSIQVITANQINDAWAKVVDKEARSRHAIDAATS